MKGCTLTRSGRERHRDRDRDALVLARVTPPQDPELPPRPRIGELLGKLRRAKA